MFCLFSNCYMEWCCHQEMMQPLHSLSILENYFIPKSIPSKKLNVFIATNSIGIPTLQSISFMKWTKKLLIWRCTPPILTHLMVLWIDGIILQLTIWAGWWVAACKLKNSERLYVSKHGVIRAKSLTFAISGTIRISY